MLRKNSNRKKATKSDKRGQPVAKINEQVSIEDKMATVDQNATFYPRVRHIIVPLTVDFLER